MANQEQPRRADADIDVNFRELQPREPRTWQPLTGVANTPDEHRVYEFGRLIAREHFGDQMDLDAVRRQLDIRDEEEERIAKNVSIVYRYLEYQNRRDYDGIIEIHHNPYINKTYFGRWPIDPAAHVRGLKGWFTIVPDATTEASKIILAAENKVIVRTTARGTQVRSFPNSMLGQGGKQWAVALIHSVEIVDGAIASCESTSPFENQWEEQIINSNFPGLGGDVSEVRARQGVNADFEYLAERAIGNETLREMHAGSDAAYYKAMDVDALGLIEQLSRQAPNQCQTLIPPKMRRCAKLRTGDSLYCLHHQEHGYGIDDEY
ncbi:MAG TPA: nuclear transport factor 2 family protein [Nitriliruptorales bacterium]|nr:nuclear transport factor 2 family protein [Nitriliruptorales bacterium]